MKEVSKSERSSLTPVHIMCTAMHINSILWHSKQYQKSVRSSCSLLTCMAFRCFSPILPRGLPILTNVLAKDFPDQCRQDRVSKGELLHYAGCIMQAAGHGLWPMAAWLYHGAILVTLSFLVSGGLVSKLTLGPQRLMFCDITLVRVSY